MFWGQIHHFTLDGACKIGVKRITSLSVLSYDLYINVLLTTLFLWPLLRGRSLSLRIKRVATRTLLAAGVALTTSTINIAVLAILHEQLGWVCLGSCGADVLINAIAIYWVTSPTGRTTTTTADTNPEGAVDNTGSNHMSFPLANGSIPNPGQACSPHEGISTQKHELDAEGDRNGEGRKPASFFKSTWSRLWKERRREVGQC